MDELIQHCLRELSFDGDLGCDVSRLRDFIKGFYSEQHNSSRQQNVDDAFCAFVWYVVVRQPGVRVGTVPPGAAVEVYVAPQPRAKSKVKGAEDDEDSAFASSLDIIEDATIRSLEDLQAQYGDGLRIAVDPEISFKALTGSHIRPSKITPMVYSALQLITRGREKGLSVVDLGKKTKYDQKTCFYLIKVLVELDLIVKRRSPGVSTNICVHKYFFDTSPVWREVREEEEQAKKDLDPDVPADGADDFDDDEHPTPSTIQFDPIDSRHLSSLPLLQARITKLLQNSPHHLHAANNMLVKLGFYNPKKTDRRFFRNRLQELMDQGVLEKVFVLRHSKSNEPRRIPCIRLVSSDHADESTSEGVVVVEVEKEDDMNNGNNLKMNVVIHRQIVDLIHQSGTRGMTLNELSTALCDFDRRTVELILSRLERDSPPSHLADIGIAQLGENHGRERRYKYFTVENYRKVAVQEGIADPDSRYLNVDLSASGEFMSFEENLFYKDEKELDNYVDNFQRIAPTASGKTKKPKVYKNPILPDGTVKKGRPRKSVADASNPKGKSARGKKRKRDDEEDQAEGSTAVRDQNQSFIADGDTTNHAELGGVDAFNQSISEAVPKRKRGRPRKNPLPGRAIADTSIGEPIIAHDITPSAETAPKKRRGRPPKKKPEPQVEPDKSAGNESIPLDLQGPDAITGTSEEVVETEPPPEAGPSRLPLDDTGDCVRLQILSEVSAGLNSTRTTSSADIEVPMDADSSPTSHPDVSADTMPTSAPDETLRDTANAAGSVVGVPSISAGRVQDLQEIDIPSSTTEIQPISSLKRSRPETVNPEPAAKKAKQGKGNISQARRENEILRVITDNGGIVNISSKDFYAAHAALIEKLTEEGEPTSTPVGARIDKRTVETTLLSLESRQKVKVVTTAVATSNRPIRIACLPDISEDEFKTFLAGVGPSYTYMPADVKTLDQPLEYGGRTSDALNVVTFDLPRTPADAEKLFRSGDAAIREALLSEKTTIAQLYGFIVGKVARARELHLSTIGSFEAGYTSSNVVSSAQRIVHISFYSEDLRLSELCTLVACLTYNEDLLSLLQTDDGQQIRLRDLSPVARQALQMSRTRTRSRLMELLDILRCLELVVPLKPSNAAQPSFVCDANGDHPTAFDIASDEHWTSTRVPTYWHFTDVAPIYLWALKTDRPPLWQLLPISTVAESIEYWHQLRVACLDLDNAQALENNHASTSLGKPNIAIAKTLRRSASWDLEYRTTWLQVEYLKRFVDTKVGRTPLQDDDSGQGRLQNICWVSGVPIEVAKKFFESEQERQLRDLNALQNKNKRKTRKIQDAGAAAEAGLAHRAAEAKRQKEHTWDELVRRVHPEPLEVAVLTRLQHVRAQFLEGSGKASKKWESQILKTLDEAKRASETLLPSRRPPLSAPLLVAGNALPPPTVSNTPEKPIEELIAQQGPRAPRPPPTKLKKRKSKTDEPAEKELVRRNRFQWNRDYDELARDACAIIKARCRNGVRLDWTALEQVFPAVPRNSVRQRIVHMRENPATDAYLTRLEDRWYDLWLQRRGTAILPDDDQRSPSNFDLVTHIKFLRNHIDKNALRVGFFEPEEKGRISLPVSVDQLNQFFEVSDKQVAVPAYDFIWNVVAEEGREKHFVHQAFTRDIEEMPPVQGYPSEDVYVADSALKMTLGTPNEDYDPEVASKLLHGIGEQAVQVATTQLLARGVLSKTVRDPQKAKPGRTLKISDSNQNALGGPISGDVYQDAVALEEILNQEDDATWTEWPLLATDGDAVALIDLVSDDQVEFNIDTTRAKSARTDIDWNSKKADDDDIETAIQIRVIRESSTPDQDVVLQQTHFTNEVSSSDVADRIENVHHDETKSGEPACCRNPYGLYDCQACLDEAMTWVLKDCDQQQASLANRIISALQAAGSKGLSTSDVVATVGSADEAVLPEILDRLTDASVSLASWTGYFSPVLVSSSHIKPWTVVISNAEGSPKALVLPRRWLDIAGRRMQDVWEAGLRAVMGVILFRPGISQAEIRWRLRSVYDRQEVNELLRYLHEGSYISRRSGSHSVKLYNAPPDDREERNVFWLLGNGRRWYQL